jgi:uncharacterized protein involved in exopolysaccharide biosynthesis
MTNPLSTALASLVNALASKYSTQIAAFKASAQAKGAAASANASAKKAEIEGNIAQLQANLSQYEATLKSEACKDLVAFLEGNQKYSYSYDSTTGMLCSQGPDVTACYTLSCNNS